MPTIAEVTDNVDTPAPSADTTMAKTEAPASKPESNDSTESNDTSNQKPMLTISDTKKILAAFHKITIDKMIINFSDQIVDGSRMEFVNASDNKVLATGRIRISNTLHLATDTGRMYIEAFVTDLSNGTASLAFQ